MLLYIFIFYYWRFIFPFITLDAQTMVENEFKARFRLSHRPRILWTPRTVTHFWKLKKRQTDPKSATIVIIRSAGESWAEEVHSIPYSIIKEHSDWLTNEKSDQWETSIIAFEFKKQKYLLLDENRIHLVTGLENVTTDQMLRVVRNFFLWKFSVRTAHAIYSRPPPFQEPQMDSVIFLIMTKI